MLLVRTVLVSAAAVTLGAATPPHQIAARASAKRMPLVPLSDADEQSTQETGCTFTFAGAGHDYLQLVGSELMLRDSQGLRSCRLNATEGEELETGKGTASCSGYRLHIRATGRSTSNAATDSNSGRAVLTVDRGGAVTSMRGIWGVAC
ncbi:hypothetical protein [Sphingomonas sp.]|uniref:hypothetical protein n=1 Tax=Sphingomonas sp. TaxID=28214 RepID=UPI0028A6F0D3|nr:hypothetical protein [Sphingomonas sp.]